MPMPAEYHENHGNHENANFALGATQDASNMTANMYRVGDYVYFETSSTSPYQIRRIEELNKQVEMLKQKSCVSLGGGICHLH